MARSRTKKPQPTDGQLADQAADAHYAAVAEAQAEQLPEPSFDPAEFDPELQQQAQAVVQQVADSTRVPEQTGFAAQHAPRNQPYIANPSSKRRESHAASVARRLPSTLGVAAGDLVVKLVDKGDNSAGIGIRVELPNGRTLTDAEKEIIRQHVKGGEGEQPSGFAWNGQVGMWAKPIVRQNEDPRDVPSNRPVAIRLDAEARVERLAEALRHHSADPQSYAELVRQQREHAANADRVPSLRDRCAPLRPLTQEKHNTAKEGLWWTTR